MISKEEIANELESIIKETYAKATVRGTTGEQMTDYLAEIMNNIHDVIKRLRNEKGN